MREEAPEPEHLTAEISDFFVNYHYWKSEAVKVKEIVWKEFCIRDIVKRTVRIYRECLY